MSIDHRPSFAADETRGQIQQETRGLWLGLLGVVIFAMTLPMTKLAVGAAADPQLPPLFVTAGRAAFAGLLSIGYLWLTGAPRLRQRDVPALAVSALGAHISAIHTAVASSSSAIPRLNQSSRLFSASQRRSSEPASA